MAAKKAKQEAKAVKAAKTEAVKATRVPGASKSVRGFLPKSSVTMRTPRGFFPAALLISDFIVVYSRGTKAV